MESTQHFLPYLCCFKFSCQYSMANSTVDCALPSVSLLAGPQLLGCVFNWTLQGFLTCQVYIYHLCFPNDSKWLKSFVYGIFVYEWVQTGLLTVDLFDVFVYDYGSLASLLSYHNAWLTVVIMSGIMAAVVQTAFAARIWLLTNSRWGRVFSVFIVTFALAMLATSIVGGVKLHEVTATKNANATPVISAWLVGCAIIDISIAVVMTVVLLNMKTGFSATDDIVNRLVRLVIETGSLTAIVALLDAILFTAVPSMLLYETPATVLTKLYSNTLLANFNNRVFMKRSDVVVSTGPIMVNAFAGRSMGSPISQNGTNSVHVLQETFTARDISLQEIESGGGKSVRTLVSASDS